MRWWAKMTSFVRLYMRGERFLVFFPSSNKFNGFHIYNTLVSQISIENIYNTLVSQISIEKRQYCVNLMCSSCGNRQIIIIIISSDVSVSCGYFRQLFPSVVGPWILGYFRQLSPFPSRLRTAIDRTAIIGCHLRRVGGDTGDMVDTGDISNSVQFYTSARAVKKPWCSSLLDHLVDHLKFGC